MFQADSGATNVVFDRVSTVVQQNSASLRSITVTYDAAMDTYSVARPAQTERFDPTQRVEFANNATRLRHDSATGTEFLTIIKGPANGAANSVVTLGLWQSASIVGSNQLNDVDVFVFGDETRPDAIPVAGKAGFRTDIFGVLSVPGDAALTFFGQTDLTVDLGRGTFMTVGQVAEGVVLTRQLGNGPYSFVASGQLTASSNDFAGNFYYNGSQRIGGQLVGHLFGSTAEELGMVFSGTNARGASFSGGLTAQRDNALIENFVVADVTSATEFPGGAGHFTLWQMNSTGAFDTLSRRLTGLGVTDQGTANLKIGQPLSNLREGAFAASDAAASPLAGFDFFERRDGDFTLGLLVNDPSSGGVPMTYLDFGVYRSRESGAFFQFEENFYFHYGVRYPVPLGIRRGQATYSGIVFGEAAGKASRTRYDLGGTSQFAFDFDSGLVSGSLLLVGTNRADNIQSSLGTYAFSGNVADFDSRLDLTWNGETRGELNGYLYRPDASEVGASFGISVSPAITGDQLIAAGITVGPRD